MIYLGKAILASILFFAFIFLAPLEKSVANVEPCKKAYQTICTRNDVVVGYGSNCVCGGEICIPNPCWDNEK